MPVDISFPFTQTFIDCAGVAHTFTFTQSFSLSLDNGFLIDAEEYPEGKDTGYSFSIWSPSLVDGLERLRIKIRRALSVKYTAIRPDGGIWFTHDKIAGRITSLGVVIDGSLINWEMFSDKITGSFIGNQFELKFFNPEE